MIDSPNWTEMPTVTMAEELIAQHRRLTISEAAWLRGLAAFDRRLGWQVLGYGSAASWLADKMGMTIVTAREKVRVARTLADRLPAVGSALATGQISYSAARTICALPDADPDTEAALVAAATAGVPVRELDALVRRARDATSPDTANSDALARYDRRGLYLTRGIAGNVLGDLELDPEDGDLLYEAIDSVLASERTAGNPVLPMSLDSQAHDARASRDGPRITPAQRRADALMTLVRAGLDHLEAAHPGRARTELLVLADLDTLDAGAPGTAQTSSGSPLTAEQARRLACDASLRRVVFRGGSEILDVGTRTRIFTAAQRAATFARDRGCRWPGCGRWWGLQLHHIHHVEHGGATSVRNGAWHCRPHHRHIHEGGWIVTGDANATLWYQPPDGRPAIASDPPAIRRRQAA